MIKHQIDQLYVPFARICKVNTILFQVFRHSYELAAYSDYQSCYTPLFNLHARFSHLFNCEQSFKLKTVNSDFTEQRKSLRRLVSESQLLCNELKLICPEDQLEQLQLIDLKLVLILRDIKTDQTNEVNNPLLAKQIIQAQIESL
jgi:hypothetical protein